MEEQLLQHLAGDAAVTALVADRIVWNARPQGEALPCIVLHRITGGRDYAMAGRTGLVESVVQIDCWGERWLSAKQVARAVVASLDGLAEEPFQAAFIDAERDTMDADDDGREFHRTMVDTRIWHSDAS